MSKVIYAMKPAARTEYLKSRVGEWVVVIYGRHYRRDAHCKILGVAPSLTNSFADQLVVQSHYGGDMFVLSSAELIRFEES